MFHNAIKFHLYSLIIIFKDLLNSNDKDILFSNDKIQYAY